MTLLQGLVSGYVAVAFLFAVVIALGANLLAPIDRTWTGNDVARFAAFLVCSIVFWPITVIALLLEGSADAEE